MHETCSLVVEEFQAAQAATSSIFLGVILALLNRNIGASGQLAQGFREWQVLVGHYESHCVSSLTTTKAAIRLPTRADVERGGLFVVKGTVSLEISTCPLQIEAVGRDKLDDVRRSEDLLNGFIGDARHRGRIVAWHGGLPNHQTRRNCEEM